VAIKASPEGTRKMDRVVTQRDLRRGEEEMQELLSHVKKTPPEELIRSPVKIVAA
jgi:hypothetical protein